MQQIIVNNNDHPALSKNNAANFLIDFSCTNKSFFSNNRKKQKCIIKMCVKELFENIFQAQSFSTDA